MAFRLSLIALNKGSLFFLLLLLVACAQNTPTSVSSSSSRTQPTETAISASVEKIQLQAGSSDPYAISELRVEPAQLDLQPLEVAKIRVLARLANGQTVEVINHSKLSWQLTNSSQISLLNGTVKALSPGESAVVIRAGTQETQLKIKIAQRSENHSQNLSVPELVLPQPLYRLALGENVYLQASLKQADGSENKDLIFSVDKPDLFELNSNTGQLRRLRAGAATVTVQARLNGDVVKTIALEDKVIENSLTVDGGNVLLTGGNVSTPQPKASATPSSSTAPLTSATPQSTPIPTATPTPLPVVTPTPTPTPIPTATPTPTPIPTATPTPIPAATAPPSSGNGKILYQLGYEIFIMNSDGTTPVNISNNAAQDLYPAWSPDGSKVVFFSRRDGNAEIYTMNADGSNVNRLTHDTGAGPGTQDYFPRWSPDGSKIAFVSDRHGNTEIYTMNALDGSNLTRLTNNTKSEEFPDWSPDGSKIVFTSFQDDANGDIYLMNSDGSNKTNITNSPGMDSQATWSPDGNKIAFFSLRDGIGSVYLMNSNGSNPTKVSIFGGTSRSQSPSWSPDGTQLLFLAGPSSMYLYRSSLDGTAPTKLIQNIVTGEDPAFWKP